MGGCESMPEEEVVEYREPRRRRTRTPIFISTGPRRIPVGMGRPMMYPTYPVRRFPMAAPVVMDAPPPYRRFYDDYDDDFDDFKRTRYSYHSYSR
ncbi:hypothetical protein DPMN_180619 [Dreissena polymorpha]|uniref:Uncharacterized protein n=1 Tax=Dreissena polymorpha TaxID=45954 RepID=A0A9D4EGH6_DREPO|nr:hypothetical protein DPMN_044653 [Dreissena polymorpha]KAH3779140.1 hypothetical protein DPMN_180619 [Dreissena polymorpha]